MGSLDKRVAIVTGAGQSVGRGIALALSSAGASVVVAEINEIKGQAVADEIEARGGQALAVRCDVTDKHSIDACLKATIARFGALHILVNNAIAAKVGAHLQDTTDADYDLVMDTGPKATFMFMRAAYPYLKGDGRVINLRSGSEVSAITGMSAYVAAKAAVGALTRVAAREWGRTGVTVNAIIPFAHEPDVKRSYLDDHPELLQAVFDRMGIPRYGNPEMDVGRAVTFLAGPDASFITGTTLSVDGGGALI
jgi:NAD(P)-dependent dehydrogenase (short-subunit alcohol dehydrogenase family)